MIYNELDVFINAWNSIAIEVRKQFFEVICTTLNEKRERNGDRFPDNINDLPWTTQRKVVFSLKGERHGMRRTDIMKENLLPEPEGITLVSEAVLWGKLKMQYRSYYINDALHIYHTDNTDSYCRSKKRNIQHVINTRWNSAYFLNHFQEYDFPIKERIHFLKLYLIMDCVLRKVQGKDYIVMPLEHKIEAIICNVFRIPISFLAYLYSKKHQLSK